MKRWIIRNLLETVYSLSITFAIGRWAVNYAYMERGYKAVGGERLLIIMTYWVAYKAIRYLFEAMEEGEDE